MTTEHPQYAQSVKHVSFSPQGVDTTGATGTTPRTFHAHTPFDTAMTAEEEVGWEEFFGPWSEQWGPKPRLRDTWNLRDTYTQQDAYMSEICIQQVTEADQYLIRQVLPFTLRENMPMEFHWDKWIFDNALWPQQPENSVPRILESQKEANRATVERHGLGIRMSHDFMVTRQGQLNFAADFNRLTYSLIETLVFGAAEAVLNAKFHRRDTHSLTSSSMSVEGVLKVLERAARLWGCVQKSRDGYKDAFKTAAHILKNRGVSNSNVFTIMPAGSISYVHDQQHRDFAATGKQTETQTVEMVKMRDPVGGDVTESRPINAGEDRPLVDPFYRQQAFGNFFHSHPSDADGTTESHHRDIEIFSFSKKNWVRLGIEDLLEHCGLWTHGKELSALGVKYFADAPNIKTYLQREGMLSKFADYGNAIVVKYGGIPKPATEQKVVRVAEDVPRGAPAPRGGDNQHLQNAYRAIDQFIAALSDVQKGAAHANTGAGVIAVLKQQNVPVTAAAIAAALRQRSQGSIANTVANPVARSNVALDGSEVTGFSSVSEAIGMSLEFKDTIRLDDDDTAARLRGYLNTAVEEYEEALAQGVQGHMEISDEVPQAGREAFETFWSERLAKYESRLDFSTENKAEVFTAFTKIGGDQKTFIAWLMLCEAAYAASGSSHDPRKGKKRGLSEDSKADKQLANIVQWPTRGGDNVKELVALVVADMPIKSSSVSAVRKVADKHLASFNPSVDGMVKARTGGGDEVVGWGGLLLEEPSYRFFKACLDANAPLPLAFLGFRTPVFSMGTMVHGVSGGAIGQTMCGHFMVTNGDDPMSRYHFTNASVYAKSLVFHEENVCRVENIYSQSYLGGYGHSIVPYDEETHAEYVEGHSVGDIIICAVPCNWQPEFCLLDITGRFDPNVIASSHDKKLYPSAHIYAPYWGWTQPTEIKLSNFFEGAEMTFSTISWMCAARKYNAATGKHDRIVVNQDPLGPNIYPGCEEVWDGYGFLRPANYLDTAVISVV